MTASTTAQKSILFVDDDQGLLDGLRRALRRHRHEWTMEFVSGGLEALRVLESRSVDVVVTDMRMPGMDGAELLARVRADHPHVVRLILSGQSSRDAVLRAADVTHQFLPKPIDTTVLERVLARSLALQDNLRNAPLRSVVGSLRSLPSLPRLYVDLSACATQEDATVRNVTDIVERDAGMSAKVLQIANSALFGLPQQTSSVGQAVSYLGLTVIKTIALTTHLLRGLEGLPTITGFDLSREQEHAILVAQLSRYVAGSKVNSDTAFTAGILHDVGKVVLAVGQPELLGRALDRSRAESRHLHEVEREICSVDHAAVGGYLLGLWGLPQQVVEGVAFHHEPLAAPNPAFDIVTTVHVADALVREREAETAGTNRDGPKAWLVREYVERLGIEGRIPEWEAAAAALQDA